MSLNTVGSTSERPSLRTIPRNKLDWLRALRKSHLPEWRKRKRCKADYNVYNIKPTWKAFAFLLAYYKSIVEGKDYLLEKKKCNYTYRIQEISWKFVNLSNILSNCCGRYEFECEIWFGLDPLFSIRELWFLVWYKMWEFLCYVSLEVAGYCACK